MDLPRRLAGASGLVMMLAAGCAAPLNEDASAVSGSSVMPQASTSTVAHGQEPGADGAGQPGSAPRVTVGEFVAAWNRQAGDPALEFEPPELQPVEDDPSRRSFVVELTPQVNVGVVTAVDDDVVRTALLGFPSGFPDRDRFAREAFALLVRVIHPSLDDTSVATLVDTLVQNAASEETAEVIRDGVRFAFVMRAHEAILFAGEDRGPVGFTSAEPSG